MIIRSTGYLLVLLFISTKTLGQADSFDPGRKYSADTLVSYTNDIFTELSLSHPGFYRYTPNERFDFLIDSTTQTITDSLTLLEYYRKLKPLVAQIGCLHTSITLSERYEAHFEEHQKYLPLEIFVDDDRRAFVTNELSENPQIPIGAELISINGSSMNDVLKILYAAIPSDGYNLTLKTLLINYQFSLWYKNMIDTASNFDVEVMVNGQPQQYLLEGVEKQRLPTLESMERAHEQQLTFDIKQGYALLTIHTFAKTVIKKNGQNFKKFVKSAFKKLEKDSVDNLVIDLRNNTGGTDGNAVYLASFFFDSTFDYWSKIETTENVANQVKGLYRIFYKKPQKLDSTYRWRGTRWWLTREFNYQKSQRARSPHYKGNVYLLTNGGCMSSCSDLVAILSHNNKAVVIGEETGGGYQGNTSGLMPNVKFLDLVLTVPLNKYTNAVDPGTNFGRGTIPHHVIQPSLSDWIEKRDTTLLKAEEVIKSHCCPTKTEDMEKGRIGEN